MNNTRLFIKYISYTLFVLLSFSCNDEDKITEKSIIKVIVNTDKTVLTKSGNTMDEVILRVEPLDNNGVITEYTLTEEEESEITIEPGQYVITAIVGKDTKGKPSVDPYYQGSETINVSSGETKNIQIECKLTTVVIGVDYSNITSIYNGYEYETIVSTTTGEQIVFSQDDTNKNGYFLPGSLNVTFRYGNNGNWKSEQMDDITNVMPQHKYIITYSIRDDSNDEGAAGVGITISDIDDRGGTANPNRIT